MCGQMVGTIVRNELARRHDENERLTRCANKIGRMVIQREQALKLAREVADALCCCGYPHLRETAVRLADMLEGQ